MNGNHNGKGGLCGLVDQGAWGGFGGKDCLPPRAPDSLQHIYPARAPYL